MLDKQRVVELQQSKKSLASLLAAPHEGSQAEQDTSPLEVCKFRIE